jgi:hypothetical protein
MQLPRESTHNSNLHISKAEHALEMGLTSPTLLYLKKQQLSHQLARNLNVHTGHSSQSNSVASHNATDILLLNVIFTTPEYG